jgi:hypothetical protein
MDYTLDSKTLVIACLENQFKDRKAFSSPFMFSDLSNGFVEENHVYYFGRLTIGRNNGSSVDVLNRGDSIIQLDENSQLDILFSGLDSITFAEAQFIGFKISMIPK